MKPTRAYGAGVITGLIIASAFALYWSSRHQSLDAARVGASVAVIAPAKKIAGHDDREAQVRARQVQPAISPRVESGALPLVSPALPTAIPPGDSTMADYLGAPVPPPINLDRKYSADELAAVFRDLSETLGIKVEKVSVDMAEFPFVLYGRIDSPAGADFFKKINAELRALPDYTYGGSVTGDTHDGATYFVLNMTPDRAYPPEQAESIRRRLMVRLQVLASGLQSP